MLLLYFDLPIIDVAYGKYREFRLFLGRLRVKTNGLAPSGLTLLRW